MSNDTRVISHVRCSTEDLDAACHYLWYVRHTYQTNCFKCQTSNVRHNFRKLMCSLIINIVCHPIESNTSFHLSLGFIWNRATITSCFISRLILQLHRQPRQASEGNRYAQEAIPKPRRCPWNPRRCLPESPKTKPCVLDLVVSKTVKNKRFVWKLA